MTVVAAIIRGAVLGLALLGTASALAAQPRLETDRLADLEVYWIDLTDKGSVIYQVANRGKGSTEKPFVVDLYIDGRRQDSVTHQPLPALSVQAVESNLARFVDCQPAIVKLVIDPQKSVREVSRANNERAVKLTPRCGRTPR